MLLKACLNGAPVLRVAVARGYDTRIGLEDTLTMPDGARAPDNAALVTAAYALIARRRENR